MSLIFIGTDLSEEMSLTLFSSTMNSKIGTSEDTARMLLLLEETKTNNEIRTNYLRQIFPPCDAITTTTKKPSLST